MTPVEQAAEEWWIENRKYSLPCPIWAQQSFIAGAAWAEKRILEMLRSDEAELPEPHYFEGPARQWADWLESRLKEEK